MVIQEVLCVGKRAPDVIDTGAVVSECSPKMAKYLRLLEYDSNNPSYKNVYVVCFVFFVGRESSETVR